MNKKQINIKRYINSYIYNKKKKLSIDVYMLKQNTLQSKMNLLYLVYLNKSDK
jgi:hypothetical protein